MGSLILGRSPSVDGWKDALPEDHGFRAGFADRLDAAVAEDALPGLHSVVIASNGRLVLERYIPNDDQRWGKPLGHVKFTRQTLHDLRSVSKSITGMLYGLALHQGKAPALDTQLIAQFGEYPDLARDPQLAALKISHVITMTMGMEWNEDVPYDDPTNSEVRMEFAPDRYRFILERPFVARPGDRWIYSGGATALLGCLIERGTGLTLLEFARANLFERLGIEDVEWVSGADGTVSAASGLRLRPRDLAKIGQLVLQRGQWQGDQVIPVDWLVQSFSARINCFDDVQYGFQWYVRAATDAHGQRIFAMGNGGQRLIVIPDRNLVVAIFCGNYNKPDQWQTPAKILLEHVLPGLVEA